MPEKAYDPIFEALLEPEPIYWLENPEFPNLWRYLSMTFAEEKR